MNVELTKYFKPIFQGKYRFFVYHGGRGSGKSWSIARALLILGSMSRLTILCAREIQKSIKDSVHKLLKEQIEMLGLDSFYQVTEKEIRGKNGTIFLFAGLKHNVTSVKSMEGVDYCWVEEAENVSENSWKVLIPTIRKKGSKFIISFNPNFKDDPTYERFITQKRNNALVCQINYWHNPWFSDELREEMEHDKATDYDKYLNIWEGQCVIYSDAQVFNGKFEVCNFEVPINTRLFYGSDYGFAQDPTTIVKVGVYKDSLYIINARGKVGLDIDNTPRLYSEVAEPHCHIQADSARPETINYLKRHGFPNTMGVKKWAGSIEDGIAFMRSFKKIYIDPSLKDVIDEFRLYSYKVDAKTDEILPIIVDKYNHYIDAIRYALSPLIMNRRSGIGTMRGL